MLNKILEFNNHFVESKGYEPYLASKFPDKEVVVVTCMDTRLVELLPKALDLRNGDVKMIKTAGAVISHPFGSVIGHHECGMGNTDPTRIKKRMIEAGIKEDSLEILGSSGINLDKWLSGFTDVYESVEHSVSIIKNHPLIPKDIEVHGLVIDPHTGKLEVVHRDEKTTE